ncbi:MAG: hydantoinase B/oxoprolinase family protein [Pseudomonadota bacterium]
MAQTGWRFWIDRGGTFTDVVAQRPDGALESLKLLSENPEQYEDAAAAGVRAAMGLAYDATLPPDAVDHVKMGTTVATNALLERKGARTLLVVNKGFADLLEIGRQSRPRLFDLHIKKPDQLYERVVEVDGRVDLAGAVLAPLNETAAEDLFAEALRDGIESCAIAFINAWKHPDMERRLADLARAAGFAHVSASHEISPLAGLLPRAQTSVADAYLSPVLRRYIDQVERLLDGAPLSLMQSNGGLVEADKLRAKDAVLSGPAGGVVGAARTAEAAGFHRVIGFDMGGTSTDVCVYDGAFERAFETEIAGAALRTPMMAVETVAAGGGSILHFDGARFRVGPDSAGADPGPACYRRGGPLTVTDANVLIGKIQPNHFPEIFGPNGDAPLDTDVVREKFAELAEEVARATGDHKTPEAIAEDFLAIAVANMARAIKRITLEKGRDIDGFVLQSFGGAGGQHACLVAEALGMDTVLIHPLAGVLSAYGMGLADQRQIRRQAIERPFGAAALAEAESTLEALARDAASELPSPQATQHVSQIKRADLRYEGTDAPLAVDIAGEAAMREAFNEAHTSRFGFATPGRPLVLESVSVEVVLPGEQPAPAHLETRKAGASTPTGEVRLYSRAKGHAAPVYARAALLAGDDITGPAIITEANATTVVEPGWRAKTLAHGELAVSRIAAKPRSIEAAERADPAALELFNNLFMAAAERMGVALRNTATSVNIRERLDFSCAVFDAEGRLVANAPHVPVHLGAMGASVRAVIEARGGALNPGDMVVLNDPANGGTHLPDITVVAPVFDEDGDALRFFVANRGHHADIGGAAPGSTPAGSTKLEEEGVVLNNVLLCDAGVFREGMVRQRLTNAPYPARNPDANIADLKAQIAANQAGAAELAALTERYTWPTVAAYMRHVMANAEESVRRTIDRMTESSFEGALDDGAALRVAISPDRDHRTARIDFTGTDAERRGNFNAPPAIMRAAVLYVFRCLVDDDIPLNEGCFAPLELVAPDGSFLSPSPGRAVVAGNTEVSQTLCNTLLGALGAQAASQGTMNNLLLGDAESQYYETICGGAGAGPGFAGASAVHTHMTNTRITDPEILELRYPLRLETFAIRRGSGGRGAFRGGDGAIRRIRAVKALTLSLVSSNRAQAPFGLEGGEAGAPGRQWLERADGARELLPGVAEAGLEPGDVIVIETPGGGGYGAPS